MDIKYSLNNSVLEISICGELDECSAFALRTTIDRIISDHIKIEPVMVVFDLHDITFMDSTGIGVLLGRYKKFIRKNVVINIKNPSTDADKILKMAGIYEIMPKIL